eukprot:424393-Rhodomonas_salina.1
MQLTFNLRCDGVGREGVGGVAKRRDGGRKQALWVKRKQNGYSRGHFICQAFRRHTETLYRGRREMAYRRHMEVEGRTERG